MRGESSERGKDCRRVRKASLFLSFIPSSSISLHPEAGDVQVPLINKVNHTAAL